MKVAKKRGNGTQKKKAHKPSNQSVIDVFQNRVSPYEDALGSRMEQIEEAKAQIDRLTAEVFQIRGALGEARETVEMLQSDGAPPAPAPEPPTESSQKAP